MNPSKVEYLVAPCLIRRTTGWRCPGCGTSRACRAFLAGRPRLAVRYNPLLIILLPYLTWRLAAYSKKGPTRGHRATDRVFLLILVVMSAIRNVVLADPDGPNSS